MLISVHGRFGASSIATVVSLPRTLFQALSPAGLFLDPHIRLFPVRFRYWRPFIRRCAPSCPLPSYTKTKDAQLLSRQMSSLKQQTHPQITVAAELQGCDTRLHTCNLPRMTVNIVSRFKGTACLSQQNDTIYNGCEIPIETKGLFAGHFSSPFSS